MRLRRASQWPSANRRSIATWNGAANASPYPDATELAQLGQEPSPGAIEAPRQAGRHECPRPPSPQARAAFFRYCFGFARPPSQFLTVARSLCLVVRIPSRQYPIQARHIDPSLPPISIGFHRHPSPFAITVPRLGKGGKCCPRTRAFRAAAPSKIRRLLTAASSGRIS